MPTPKPTVAHTPVPSNDGRNSYTEWSAWHIATGQWTSQQQNGRYINGGDGYEAIAEVYGKDRAESLMRAQLFCAAPALVEALERVVRFYRTDKDRLAFAVDAAAAVLESLAQGG